MPKSDKPFAFEQFKKIYSQVPRLCVEVVIRGPEGTLLSLRKIPPHKGTWHLPGGTVRFKEPVELAVKRIALDELGVKVSIDKFLGYIEFLHTDKFGGFDHPVSLAFLCQPHSSDYRPNEQAGEIKFFNILPDNTEENQKNFLESLA